MIIGIIFISFFLDCIINILIGQNHIFNSLCFVISIAIIYPYFKEHKNFLIVSFLIGLVYDLVITNTFILNGVVFFLLSLLIIKLNNKLSSNILNINFIFINIIIGYRLITYIILVLISYLSIDFNVLIISILKSIVINLIIGTFIYVVSNMISEKLKINKKV